MEAGEEGKRPLSPTSFHDWQRRSNPIDSQDFDINACIWAFSNETRLLTADLNGDGRTDLVCFYYQGNGSLTLFLQLADGYGGFQQWQEWGGGDGLFDCELFRLADVDGDVDGDGLTDLICPYVEPNGSVATYVQQVAFHQVHLPILMK